MNFVERMHVTRDVMTSGNDLPLTASASMTDRLADTLDAYDFGAGGVELLVRGHSDMDDLSWWGLVDDHARAWLIEHNGEAVAPDVLDRIVAAGGDITSDAWWVGQPEPESFHLSDEATDWIETVANEE